MAKGRRLVDGKADRARIFLIPVRIFLIPVGICVNTSRLDLRVHTDILPVFYVFRPSDCKQKNARLL